MSWGSYLLRWVLQPSWPNMGKWATYRKRGRAVLAGFPLPPPSVDDFSLSDEGGAVVFAYYSGPGGAGADRFVVAASDDGFLTSTVSALTALGDPAVLALSSSVLWEVKISLWNDASTSQLSDWSPVRTITPA
jgi:hypothetical protein